MKDYKILWAITAAMAIAVLFLLFGLAKTKTVAVVEINSFEECAAIYPVMESYPRQCNTPDGQHFVEDISEDEAVACTLDAFVCPDGTSVGRVAPNCEFAACPGQ